MTMIVTCSIAPGRKCTRCWKVLIEVGDWPEHPNICLRCVDAVLMQETGEGMMEHAMRRFDAAFREAVAGGASKGDAVRIAAGWNWKGRERMEVPND